MNDKSNIDELVYQTVFTADESTRGETSRKIREIAAASGIYPASIQGLYDASGKGLYSGKTVPAINIRGLTYDVARAIFRAILKDNAWACIFELARSEMGYTLQSPDEYTVVILAPPMLKESRETCDIFCSVSKSMLTLASDPSGKTTPP